MEFTDEIIKKIAEDLDCGLVCYINKETNEIKSIIDPNNAYAEREFWEADLKEIEDNWKNYILIDKMPSNRAFNVMEAFTLDVSDEKIQDRLMAALDRRKPFQNFKYEVDGHEEVRQDWFKFKAQKYQDWVRMEIEGHSDEEE